MAHRQRLRHVPVGRRHGSVLWVRLDQLTLRRLTVENIAELLKNRVAYYFLIAAASLNRTSLKKAAQEPEACVVGRSDERDVADLEQPRARPLDADQGRRRSHVRTDRDGPNSQLVPRQ